MSLRSTVDFACFHILLDPVLLQSWLTELAHVLYLLLNSNLPASEFLGVLSSTQ